ncbi:GroES-like protein [Mycena albidolilacea]|uniref:GroES-like protein n=1 Tax=Mycena albidolilacea TaxID=1033008 RepID=A0AAD7F6T1_9AGAR|nr:GroES-like protein [Mycena albidolilacea]
MSVQQAIVVESPKAPFTLGSAKIPSPAKGEVLVKILSVALNPADWKQREYDVIREYPAVLGCDVAGVVEKLGEGAEGFKKGDKVFAQIPAGGFQQYTTVPAAVLMPIPENANFDEVATIPVAFTTAAVGLFAAAPIGLGLNPNFSWDKPHQGESALVIGAATSVGQFVIQLFKFLGFTRIIAYASKTHFDYLKQLGATEFVDRVEVPVASLAAHPALSPPVKVVFDVGNAPDEAYDCVADGGSIATAVWAEKPDRNMKGKKVTVASAIGYIAGADLGFVGYLGTPEHTVFGRLIIRNLPEMFKKGVVVANRIEILPNGLVGILGGLERLQKGSVSGVKLVAHPQDPAA